MVDPLNRADSRVEGEGRLVPASTSSSSLPAPSISANPATRSTGAAASAPPTRFKPMLGIWLRDLIISLAISAFIIVFIYQPVKVEGTSMMPLLADQERIFINKFTYRFGIGDIERGDMVVFWFPLDRTKSYIKR